jgi:cell division protein FtsL
MRGLKTMASTFVIVLILIAFYLLFVSSRLWVVNLGYRTSQALKEQRELFEENEKLRIERATLISPERIDSYARERLGMREPKENQIRFVP